MTQLVHFSVNASNMEKLENIRKKFNCVCFVEFKDDRAYVTYNDIGIIGGYTSDKFKEAFGYKSMSAADPKYWT